jgi:hypothetical protein
VATASFSDSSATASLAAMNATTVPTTSVSPGRSVCGDGSLTDVLALTTSLLPDGSAFGSAVLSNNSTFIQVSETNLNLNTVVTISTNLPTTCPEGELAETVTLTTALTNIITSSTITNFVTSALSILLLDPQGNPLSTLFEFDTPTTITKSDTIQRFFVVSTGGHTISNLDVFGNVSFDDVVFFGQIQSVSNGALKSVIATIQASGTNHEGELIFQGKLTADNPFIAAPTNLNANALSK